MSDDADPTFLPVNVFRFQNQTNGATFLTLNLNERDLVEANLPGLTRNAAPEFEALSPEAAGEDGSVPVFRFFNLDTGGHFFTASEVERDFVLANEPLIVFEGTGFAAFLNEDDAEGLTPVFRLFDLDTGTHLFITGEAERAAVLENDRVLDEGVAFYAFRDETASDQADSVAINSGVEHLLV